MRGTDYDFVTSDPIELESRLISRFEELTGRTLRAADPERVFLAWVTDSLVHERVKQNYTGNQNIPSRAVGENLDALGKWIFDVERQPAQAAKCLMRFNITVEQASAISIPSGTRVTDAQNRLVWETTEDTVVPIGQLYVEVMAQCQTPGVIGNGFAVGEINTLIDVDNILYFDFCSNVTETDAGAEIEDDESYYERLRESLDRYSTAGAEGSYIYWAKTVSNEIRDVKAIRPSLTRTGTFPVLTDGTDKLVCLGGAGLLPSTLIVSADGEEAVENTDYTVDYEHELLTVTVVPGGALDEADTLTLNVKQDIAGHVNIYALMNDGNIASQTVKTAIYGACNDKYVRPLTDFVQVLDPDVVDYDIDVTYYMYRDSDKSVIETESAVQEAVNKYIEWQCSRLGRDINPSVLWQYLMETGIKRVVINLPAFTVLKGGTDGETPQLAHLNSRQIIQGGYEDE